MLWSKKKSKSPSIKAAQDERSPHRTTSAESIHLSQNTFFSSHASEIFPYFHAIFHIYAPLNGFKQAQSGKNVMIYNGMGPRKESLGMVLCCGNLCLTAESTRLD